MTPKYVSPSISAHSFSCPHCGTLAHQTWFRLYGDDYTNDELPLVHASPDEIEYMRHLNDDNRKNHAEFADKINAGRLFIDPHRDDPVGNRVHNLHLSQCYSCGKWALWLHDKLLYPAPRLHVECNTDIPDEIRADFDEAREIFFLSPRGAAALLRLAVQKLCAVLGEPGKNINDDIASLVKKGLSVQVQQALDIVRVIGNDAVHPGQIDLNDDSATAESLFELLNIIIEETISEPKRLQAMYDKLPQSKRDAIAKRDGTAQTP
jgi:Domain of unknown function (DUF4145)